MLQNHLPLAPAVIVTSPDVRVVQAGTLQLGSLRL